MERQEAEAARRRLKKEKKEKKKHKSIRRNRSDKLRVNGYCQTKRVLVKKRSRVD
jgi:hypothetical protein